MNSKLNKALVQEKKMNYMKYEDNRHQDNMDNFSSNDSTDGCYRNPVNQEHDTCKDW